MVKIKFENFGLFYPTMNKYDGTSFPYVSFNGGMHDCVSFAQLVLRCDEEISFVHIVDAVTGELAATVERDCEDAPEFLDDKGFEVVEDFNFSEEDYPDVLDDKGFEVVKYPIESEEF